MEYVDKKEEKKKKDYLSPGNQSSPKLKSAKELMSSFHKDNPELAKKYGIEENGENKTEEKIPEPAENTLTVEGDTTEEEQKEKSTQETPVAENSVTGLLENNPENKVPVAADESKEVVLKKEEAIIAEDVKEPATDLAARETEVPQTETAKKGEEGAGGPRMTEMKDASLDGGVERIEALNTTIKESTSQHLTTGADEKINAGIKKIEKLTTNEKEKESPEQKIEETKQAVVEKPEDKTAEKQAAKVKEIEQLPKPVAKKEDAKKILLDSIQTHLPTTVEGVDSFKKDGIANLIGDEVKNTVESKTKEINNNFSKIGKTDQPAAPKKSVPLAEIEKAVPTPALNLGADLIPKLGEESIDLSSYATESDNLLKREGIKQEHLDLVDSGDLAEAKKMMEEVEAKSDQEPGTIKKEEQSEHNKVNKELGYHESLSKEKMEKERAGQLNESKKRMGGGVSSMEAKRKEVTDHIQGIYDTTNTKVQAKLDALKNAAFVAFEQEEKKASQKFSDNVKSKLDKFKEERYSGTTGGLVEFWDEHIGDLNENPEVKKILDDEKNIYINELDGAIGRIMAASQKAIDECKAMVTEARTKIDKYVKGLEPGLKQIGEKAQADIKKKLDELDEKVNRAAEELKKELENKKAQAIANIEKKIDDVKESLKSTLSKAGGLLIDAAMKFFQWALESAGYATDQIMGILNKGKAVITAIVNDPIQFMNNLASAVGGGIKAFGENIQEHLGAGFMGWLTGKLSTLPIQMPEKWDLKGIMSLVMQVLGLGWGMLRGKLSQSVGEDKMSFVEGHATEGLEIVTEVKEKGPIALWDMVSEKGEEIKEGLMGGAKEWAVFELVKQGIIKLVSMLNPAGAIVQAILAIYGGVMFFVDNMDRIAEFVNSIINSISSIANGAVSAASKLVEKTMALTIPLILDFLAKMLNLGGIAERITKIIQRIRKPIDEVIEKVIAWIAKKVKQLFGKKGNKKGEPEKEQKYDSNNDKRDEKEKRKDLHDAMLAATKAMDQPGATVESIKQELPKIKNSHGLKVLVLKKRSANVYYVDGEVNPMEKSPDKTLSEKDDDWEQTWKVKQSEIDEKMQKFIPNFLALDPNAEVRIRGSVASGVKLNPDKKSTNGEPYLFNPTDFDVDAYVVSQQLFDGAKNKTIVHKKRGQVPGTYNPAVKSIVKNMAKELALISGNRDVGDLMYKFNVVIRIPKNAAKTVASDRRDAKALGLNEDIGNPIIIKHKEDEE